MKPEHYESPAYISKHTGISISTLYAWLKRGHLPDPAVIVNKTPGWRKEVLDAWIADPRRKQIERPRMLTSGKYRSKINSEGEV